MTDFSYEDLLPVGADETPYRLLTTEGVSVAEGPGGRQFLQVEPEALRLLTETAMHDIAHYLRPAHLQQLRQHPRRPGGERQRQVRGARPAQEREHRGGWRPADVPGHRHGDRHGQARPARAHRRARRGADQPRGLRRLHPAQPALLADGAGDDVGRAQHRLEPARPGRDLRRHRGRARDHLQVPLHGQGWRQRQQVVPVPGDQGDPQPRRHDALPRREAARARHGGLPALPPGHRHRRHERRVRPQDSQVRERQVPRPAAQGGRPGHRPRLPRHRARGEGARAHPAVRHRRAVRRQVLLPRRARRAPAPARRLAAGGHRGVVLGRPAGARQDHARRRVPRAARDRPGALPPGPDAHRAGR